MPDVRSGTIKYSPITQNHDANRTVVFSCLFWPHEAGTGTFYVNLPGAGRKNKPCAWERTRKKRSAERKKHEA